MLPRLLLAQNYNSTWPPLWQHVATSFVVCYGVSFAVLLLMNWLGAKRSKQKKGEEQPQSEAHGVRRRVSPAASGCSPCRGGW